MTRPGMPLLALLLVGTLLVATNQPFASWLVALSILAFSGWQYRSFDRQIGALQSDLESLRSAVDAAGEPLDVEGLEVPAGLALAWQDYRDDLWADARDGRTCSRDGAAAVFTAPALIERRMNLALFQAMPSMLIGIGIFFTFLGLAAALAYASKGVTSSDLSVTQAALKNLFDAASFKFITSIAALASSVLFTMGEKRSQHHLKIAIEATCRTLDRRFPPLRFERALLEAVTRPAGADSLQAASRAIETLVSSMQEPLAVIAEAQRTLSPTALGETLGEALGRLFEVQLVPVFADIRDELAELRTIKADQGQAMLANLMAEMRREVIEPIAERLDQSAALTRESSRAVTALSKDLAGVTRQFKATTQVIEGFQGQTLERLEGFAGRLGEILTAFNHDTRGVLEGIASEVRLALAESIRGLAAQREAFEASARETTGTFQTIRHELHASVETTTAAHRLLLEGMQHQMVGMLDDANATFAGATEAMELLMASSVTALEGQREAFSEGTRDTAITFQEIREELAATLKTQAEIEAHMLQALQARTTAFVDRIETSLTQQMETLRGIGEQTAGLIDHARDNLVGSLETIQSGLGQTREAAQGELETFRLHYQAALHDFFTRQNDLLEGTLGEQRQGLAATVEALDRVLAQEAARRGATAEESERALGAMRDAMVELHRYAGGIGLYSGERIEQLQRLASSTAGQVDQVERAYQSLIGRLDEAMGHSNQQLARYLETAEGRQGQFFEAYDSAVSKLYDKLLQAANYLVEADRHRRDLSSL